VSSDSLSSLDLLSRYAALAPSLAQAARSNIVSYRGLRLRIPGDLSIRLSVLAGNTRMCALLDAVLRPGETFADVGANIGVVAAYASRRVGPKGRVFAIEPAADNLHVLHENLARNELTNVTALDLAAGRRRESRQFYLRGDISAVNSLFPQSCYAQVTGVAPVNVAPLDELVEGTADVVKIDVEGAELDVLGGMPRLLAAPGVRLVIEWHPVLQEAAGYAQDELPRTLLDAGFRIDAVGHLASRRLQMHEVGPLAGRLHRAKRPVELFARR
jgi:FkbM family methyltransferase